MTVVMASSVGRRWGPGSAAAVAVAAAATVLCAIAVLGSPFTCMLTARGTQQSVALRPAHPPLQPQLAGLGNGSRPAALPCAFNTLLNNGDVQWSERNGTAHRLSIRGCNLHRYTHEQAKQCLAGKRLVFVGDSITRYQYLSLTYFLEKGKWPAPLGGVPGDPSVTNEHEWPSWNDFLKGTSALFGGRELCDCYRAHYILGVTPKPPESEKFENRFYTSKDKKTSVSHFTYTTEPQTVHGHAGFPPYSNGQKPCLPANCTTPADWQFRLAPALRKVVGALQPTHVVLNSGLWGSSNAFGDDAWRAIAAAGLESVSQQQGRVIWRTTTANRGPRGPTRDHDASALQFTAAEGWAVLDAYTITRPLMQMQNQPLWDARHFQAVVYQELNLYLLNMICEPQL